jgi:hypothetical protein
LRRSFGWLVRSLRGDPYAQIAAIDGVTEEAVKSAVADLRAELRHLRGAGVAKGPASCRSVQSLMDHFSGLSCTA